MKYDEKRRRKKLKRKIWVAAAVLAMLGVITAWTWGEGWRISHSTPRPEVVWEWYENGDQGQGHWVASPGTYENWLVRNAGSTEYILQIDQGRIMLDRYSHKGDMKIWVVVPSDHYFSPPSLSTPPPVSLEEIDSLTFRKERKTLTMPEEYSGWNCKYSPHIDVEGGKGFRFMGFEISNLDGYWATDYLSWKVNVRQLKFPIWLLAVAPALLVAWWSFQLRRAGRRDSAFPVITK